MAKTRKQRAYCPEQLIEHAVENNYVNSLALFLRMKVDLSHGWFFFQKDAAKRLNVRKSTFNNHIRILIKHGLIERNSAGAYRLLCREGINQLFRNKHKCTVVFLRNDNLTQIKYAILIKLKEKSARQQQHRIQATKLYDSLKGVPSKAFMKAVQKEGGYKKYNQKRIEIAKYAELLMNTGFTHEKCGEIMGVSKATAYRIHKQAEERNFCKTTVLSVEIAKLPHNRYKELREVFLERFTHVYYEDGSAKYNVCHLYAQREYWKEKPRSISAPATFQSSLLYTKPSIEDIVS